MKNSMPATEIGTATNARAAHDIHCVVYDRWESLSAMQSEWDAFVESVHGDIYMTYDWCRIWWEYYGAGRELRIYVFRNSAGLVGILPMFFEKVYVLIGFIKIGKIIGSDFSMSQICLPIQPEYLDPCICLLGENIASDRWQILRLGPLAGLYQEAASLEGALRRHFNLSGQIVVRKEMVQTYYKLQSNWEEHLSRLSKGQRREIVRKYNKLAEIIPGGESNIKNTYAGEDNLERIYDAFVSMHQGHWQRLGKLGHFGDWPKSYAYHKAMAAAQLKYGRLRLMCSAVDNEVLGYEYTYKFGDRYYALLNARTETGRFKDIGPGVIVFGEQVKEAISEKVSDIDAMRGYYEYKIRLGGEVYPTQSIIVIRRGIWNAVKSRLFRNISEALDYLYYRIWFQRVAPKLPFKRQSLWKLWIRTRI